MESKVRIKKSNVFKLSGSLKIRIKLEKSITLNEITSGKYYYEVSETECHSERNITPKSPSLCEAFWLTFNLDKLLWS